MKKNYILALSVQEFNLLRKIKSVKWQDINIIINWGELGTNQVFYSSTIIIIYIYSCNNQRN